MYHIYGLYQPVVSAKDRDTTIIEDEVVYVDMYKSSLNFIQIGSKQFQRKQNIYQQQCLNAVLSSSPVYG
jgi:hypothetical protein